MADHPDLVAWDDIPDEVRYRIEDQPYRPMCGCHSHGGGWWLCPFHQGMTDGIRWMENNA